MSLGVPEKPMDIFQGWENYMQLLEQNWRDVVQPEDTIVLAGSFVGHEPTAGKSRFRIFGILAGTKNHSQGKSRLLVEFYAENAAVFCG